jgi:MATE family multidrug resistance protein
LSPEQFRKLSVVAFPLVLAQLAQNSVSFVDTLMVGQLGNEAIAGIALGSNVFHFVSMVLLGVILAVSPIVSQATGANDEEKSGRALRQGLWLGLILFLPAFILFWNAYPLMIWMNQPVEVAKASAAYLRAISWGLLPCLWIMALRGYLEGQANMRPIMLICFVGVALNVFANDVLMFGRYGFPALGLVGTGYASTIVYIAVCGMFMFYVSRKYKHTRVFHRLTKPDVSMMKELIRVGVPISLTLAFEGGMFSAATFAMGTLGQAQLAAHQIAVQMASITFMIPLGFAIACSVLVGQAIGRKDAEGARMAGQAGMIVCVAVMAFTGIVLWVFPRTIVSLFLDVHDPVNGSVVNFAVTFLRIAALFQVVDGLQVAANGSLRGLKDTTASMILTLISYWLIGCSIGAYLCFWGGMGGRGLWVGMTIGLAAAAVLLTWRFFYQVKKMSGLMAGQED